MYPPIAPNAYPRMVQNVRVLRKVIRSIFFDKGKGSFGIPL
jgi:hypothetical protein